MNENPKELPIQWKWQNQTFESLEKHAQWLREQRRLGSGCEHFFNMAGKLLRLSAEDYALIVPAFFQTVIGLERALRFHYKPEHESYGFGSGSTDVFAHLLQRAVDEGIIHDELFPESTLPAEDNNGLKQQIKAGERSPKTSSTINTKPSYSQQLALSIPALRNDYFHGNPHFLTPGILDVMIDLRIIADTLKTKGEVSLRF